MLRVLFFIRMTMSRKIQRICLFLFCLPVFGSCMKRDYGEMEDFSVSAYALVITNEGNFQYSNATLSYYDPATCDVETNVKKIEEEYLSKNENIKSYSFTLGGSPVRSVVGKRGIAVLEIPLVGNETTRGRYREIFHLSVIPFHATAENWQAEKKKANPLYLSLIHI